MKALRLFSATVLLLNAAAAALPAASLLTNGSFEAVDASASPYFIRSFTSTPGWTQYLDGVDLIHNNYTQGPPVLVSAFDGVQFLDMNQAGSLGGLYQQVAATAGTTYRLTLETAAWAQNSIGGTIGYDLYDPSSATTLATGSYTDRVGGTWISRQLDAVATGNQIGVRIYGVVATQAGIGLDNVGLQALGANTPEPGTFGLLTLACAGLLTLRRR
jgi:hypothetical protein